MRIAARAMLLAASLTVVAAPVTAVTAAAAPISYLANDPHRHPLPAATRTANRLHRHPVAEGFGVIGVWSMASCRIILRPHRETTLHHRQTTHHETICHSDGMAALVAAPATAHADPPPPPANCDQTSGDADCQPQHHRKFCGFVIAFPIMCTLRRRNITPIVNFLLNYTGTPLTDAAGTVDPSSFTDLLSSIGL
jgi:hypothetical protein